MSAPSGCSRPFSPSVLGPKAHQFHRVSRRLLALVLLACAPLSGCSVILVKPAKLNDEPNPSCTINRAAPALDVMFALGQMVAYAYYSSQQDMADRDLWMTAAAMWAGIHTGSAIYGFRNTGECIESKGTRGWDDFGPSDRDDLDPDQRRLQKKKKPPVRLQPEQGVMRSS